MVSSNVSYELENDVPGIIVNAVIVSGNRVRVAVKDHGSGIAEPFRSQVFQKFAQGDSSDIRKKGGTGLGLSITRAIVEKMGGMIGFNSEPNVLTAFFIEFLIGAEKVSEAIEKGATGFAIRSSRCHSQAFRSDDSGKQDAEDMGALS
jgi:signal transduction histidine kinase